VGDGSNLGATVLGTIHFPNPVSGERMAMLLAWK